MTVTPEGALGLTEPLMLTSATTTRNVFGRVTWASSTWIATWSETEDYSSGDVYVQHVSGDGTPLGSSVVVNETAGTALLSSPVWTGSTLFLVWGDFLYGQLHARVLDEALAPLTAESQVTDSTGQVMFPEATWSGGEVDVVWQDARYGTPRAYMNTIGFCD